MGYHVGLTEHLLLLVMAGLQHAETKCNTPTRKTVTKTRGGIKVNSMLRWSGPLGSINISLLFKEPVTVIEVKEVLGYIQQRSACSLSNKRTT